MAKFKIIDYSYPTAGELARLILAYKGVEYEDYQVETPDEIYEAEEASPFGFLPILMVDGETVAQVQGICRYLSAELGLTGKNRKEAAICDMIMDSLGNMFYQFRLDQVSKLDPEEQMKMIKKMMTEDVPRYLQMYERFLEKENHKSGYLASEDLTWCDLGVALTFAGMQIRQPNLLTNYPRLQNFVKKVTSNEVVCDFIQKRHMPKETTTSV